MKEKGGQGGVQTWIIKRRTCRHERICGVKKEILQKTGKAERGGCSNQCQKEHKIPIGGRKRKEEK